MHVLQRWRRGTKEVAVKEVCVVEGSNNLEFRCTKAAPLKTCFVFLQADWATALTLWCQNMEVFVVIHLHVGVSLRRAPSISSVSLDTTSASTVSPDVATGSGSLRYLPASLSKVRICWKIQYPYYL